MELSSEILSLAFDLCWQLWYQRYSKCNKTTKSQQLKSFRDKRLVDLFINFNQLAFAVTWRFWRLHYRYSIPAPVDRTCASVWSYKHLRITYKYHNLNISMTHVYCKSKVRLVIRSFLHPYPKKWVSIGHAVMHYAWSAHEFSARIKCRHCS